MVQRDKCSQGRIDCSDFYFAHFINGDNSTVDGELDGDKEMAARLFFQPFKILQTKREVSSQNKPPLMSSKF